MENNELKNEQVGLLKRAYAQLKSSKIVKRLALLTITAATILTLSACEEVPNEPDGPSFNIGGTQNGLTDENRNPIDVSEYSQILQNILLDKTYDNLIYQATVGKNYQLLETGVFEPHPYAFLESEGFDVQAIKNDEIDAYTMSFVKDEEPNHLYIFTRVMQDNSYWTNYLLKYKLTDKEMDDYHFLHTGEGKTAYFIQSVLMNNEISKTRKPEIVGKANISIDAIDKFTNDMQRIKLFENGKMDILFTNPNAENLSFEMFLIPRYNDEWKMCFEDKIIHSKCAPKSPNLFRTENDIFLGPTALDIDYKVKERKDYNVTYYFSQDANVRYINCQSLEDTGK